MRRADFLRVASAGRKWAAPGLVLQARRRSEDGEAIRVGFTATKKVGIAVVRNRARRRLRAAVDRILPAHAASGTDYVVIARMETATRPFPLLLADLETALKRLGAWREEAAC